MRETSISQLLWRQQHPNLYHPPTCPSIQDARTSISQLLWRWWHLHHPAIRPSRPLEYHMWSTSHTVPGRYREDVSLPCCITDHQQCIGLQLLDTDILHNLAFVIVSRRANVVEFLINLVPEFVAFVLQNYFALHPWWVNEKRIQTCENSHH